ncbi:tetratricopeptide repeat protein [candidate division FCPU426 bacterium]|nr:tetratricopeptide repeat protein [candidate division FCPU426 bacterium]
MLWKKHAKKIQHLLFALFLPLFGLTLICFAEDASLEELKKLSISQPNNPNAHFNLGLYYYQQGMYPESMEALKKVIGINGNDEEALVLLGSVHLRLGELKESESVLQKVIRLNPNNIDAQNNLGLVYFNNGQQAQAVNCLQESLKIKPDNLDALNNLGFIYSTLNQTDEAARIYRRILGIDPDSMYAYERLAQLYLRDRKYADVMKLYNQAKGKTRNNTVLVNAVGFAYFNKDDAKNAYEFFSRANKLNPGDPDSHFGMGMVAYKKANLDIAIKKFKQAIKLKKDFIEAHRQLAMVYEDKGEYMKSLYFYRKLLKLDPSDRSAKNNYRAIRQKAIDYYLRKGSKAYFDNDYENAVKSWNNVRKLDPENATANKFIKTARMKLAGTINEHIEKGESFLRRNQQQDAYREFRAALKLDPKNHQAMKGMEKVKLQQKEKDAIKTAQAMDSLQRGTNVKSALMDLKTTLKKDPSNIVAKKMVNKVQKEQQSGTERNYRKGIELYSKGKLREAIAFLERALEMDPKDQGIKNLLYKARTQLRENVKALMARGIELANAGRIPEAKEKFNEILILDPENAEANEYLTKFTGKVAQVTVSKEEIKKLYYDGVSLYLDGQNRRAIEVWKKILILDPENQEAKSSITKAEMELKEMEKRGIKTQ